MQNDLRLAIWVTALLALVIAGLTLMPSVPGPAMVNGQDKINHFIAFAALSLPISMARPRWILAAAVVMTLFGGLIEIIQPYVGRGREFGDLVADMLGIAAGAGLGLLGNRLLRRLRNA